MLRAAALAVAVGALAGIGLVYITLSVIDDPPFGF